MLYHMNIKAFVHYVTQRRVALGLTQDEVAEIAEVSKTAVSDLENFKTKDVKASTLIGLSKALSWTADQIFLAYDGINPESETNPTDEAYVRLVASLIEKDKDLFKKVLKQVFREDLETNEQDK